MPPRTRRAPATKHTDPEDTTPVITDDLPETANTTETSTPEVVLDWDALLEQAELIHTPNSLMAVDVPPALARLVANSFATKKPGIVPTPGGVPAFEKVKDMIRAACEQSNPKRSCAVYMVELVETGGKKSYVSSDTPTHAKFTISKRRGMGSRIRSDIAETADTDDTDTTSD
jgi:hypothetical protein